MTTTKDRAPSFTLEAPHKAGRVSIPAATLTFTGCDPERSHEPRACFNVTHEAPATVNGAEVYGTVYLSHGSQFVRWVNPDEAERRIGWGARDNYVRRVSGETTDAQRAALRAFAEAWADRVGDADVIRAAEVARLKEEAAREAGKAAELRAEAGEHEGAAHDRIIEAEALTTAPGLFAVVMHSKTASTHSTKAAALRAAVKVAHGRKWGAREVTSHDFPSVLDVFAGRWVPVPERDAMEAAEEAERAEMRAKL
jgi:hypothetical protein